MTVFTHDGSQYKVTGPRVYPTNAFEPFNGSDVHTSISRRFEEQVTCNPGRRAISTRQRHYTYDELNSAANHIARLLLDHLREEEKGVGLFMEQGAPIVAAILGILKAGKFYVPLNAVFSGTLNAFMVEDSEVAVVLTDKKNILACECLGVKVINLDEQLLEGPADNLNRKVAADAIAYTLYTSGSTGRPKGVVQTDRNVLHNVMKYTNGAHINRDDRLTLLSATSFGASVSDIFGALLNGASLYPLDLREQGFRELSRLLKEEQITIYHSVPSVYRGFLSTLTTDDSFPKLRMIKLGGETVTGKDVELYKEHFGRDCLLHVGLGATEMGIIRQFFMNHDTVISGSLVPVGYPVADTEIVLVDEANQVVEPGLPGEIAIRSEYLPLGKGSMYLTGDLGLMLPDGCLFHLGRKDFQVKIRGYRVELIEIELALKSFPGIRDAVVLGLETENGDRSLVAYLVTSQIIKTNEVRRLLRERLPAFMIPSKYIFVDALPLTPNGKIDRPALSRMGGFQPPNSECNDSLTGSPTEQTLAAIWKELLSLNHIGYDDNFFELGGHSLLSLRLVAAVNNAFKINLPLNGLYQYPTISHMAAVIAPMLTTGSAASPVSSTLMPITLGATSDPPLFIVPGGFGLPDERIITGNFISHLAADVTLYALIHRGADGRTPGHKDVISMASEFIEEIRRVQSAGPYYILGACAGSSVAFEMARQLEQSGEKVALLAMIDGRYTTTIRWFTDCLNRFRTSQYILQFPKHLGRRLRFLARGLKRLQLRYRIPYLLRASRTLAEEIEVTFHADPHLGALTRRERLHWQYRRTLRRYRPGHFSGNLKLVLCHEFEQKPVVKEWQRVVGGTVEAEFVPGDHSEVLSTYSDRVAAYIERFYKEALSISATVPSSISPRIGGGKASSAFS